MAFDFDLGTEVNQPSGNTTAKNRRTEPASPRTSIAPGICHFGMTPTQKQQGTGAGNAQNREQPCPGFIRVPSHQESHPGPPNSAFPVTSNMDISSFVIGKTYRIFTKDWVSPFGESIPGEIRICRILPHEPYGKALSMAENRRVPASRTEVESRKNFLRVQYESGRICLLHPTTIRNAEEISE